jgi:hypothetical protein
MVGNLAPIFSEDEGQRRCGLGHQPHGPVHHSILLETLPR